MAVLCLQCYNRALCAKVNVRASQLGVRNKPKVSYTTHKIKQINIGSSCPQRAQTDPPASPGLGHYLVPPPKPCKARKPSRVPPPAPRSPLPA